jgi:hypothetical protein
MAFDETLADRIKTRGRLQDLDGALQLGVLALQLADLPAVFVGTPGAWPASTSAWRSHLRSVSALIPSRPAIARIAAYSVL